MPKQTVARPFFRPANPELRYLPEGPQLLGGRNLLAWVAIQHGPDIPSGSLNLLDLETLQNRSMPLPGRPGFFAETADPKILIVGLERRLVHVSLDSGEIVDTLAELPEDPRVIINEGIAVPDGVIFGTKHLEFNKPIAALYHFDGTVLRELRGGQICSNGKYFRDGVLIDIDSQPKTISEYRYQPGGALEFIRLVTAPEDLPALPDGLRAMPDGQSIVVAFFNPGNVADGVAQQLSIATGEVLHEWVIPGSPRVTCPALVTIGGRRQILFTTAIEGMPPETCAIAPEAGTMFVADL